MKIIRTFVFLSAFLGSLFLGFQAAVSVSTPGSVAPAEASGEAAVPLSGVPVQPIQYQNGQRTILVVLAESLDSLETPLEGVWLVSVVPPDARLTLLPVYPSPENTGAAFARALTAAFKLEEVDGEPQLVNEFLQALRTNDIWWSDVVLIDRLGIGSLMEYLTSGALSLTGDSPAPTGAALLADFGKSSSEPEVALAAQAGVFQQMCWGAGQFDFRTDLDGLFEKLAGRMVSSARSQQTAAGLAGMHISPGSLVCEFPTLPARVTW